MEKIMQLYHQKILILHKLLELTSEMKNLAETHDVDEVLMILGKREQLMKEVDLIDESIRSKKEGSLLPNILQLEEEIKEVLKDIILRDEQLRGQLKKGSVAMKEKIKQLKQSKVKQQAYFPRNQNQLYGEFIDNKE